MIRDTGVILFYDTETTGFPLWHERSDLPQQPHLVQVSAVLRDRNGQQLAFYDRIVHPSGWTIPPDVIKIHGITNKMALEQGRPESEVLGDLLHLWERADLRVAHGERFDARIVRIACKRYRGDPAAERWSIGQSFCTMLKSIKLVGAKQKNGRTPKSPTMREAYESLTGKPWQGKQHDAMWDCQALIAVYDRIVALQSAFPLQQAVTPGEFPT